MNRALGKLVPGRGAAVSAGEVLLGSAGLSAGCGKDGNPEGGEFGGRYLTGRADCVFDICTTDAKFADDTFRSKSR